MDGRLPTEDIVVLLMLVKAGYEVAALFSRGSVML